MRESRVIEQNGVFVGAAVRLEHPPHQQSAPEWRFVAVNGWLAELDGSQWPSLDELRHATARGFANRAGTTDRPAAGPTNFQRDTGSHGIV
jgi:hypothetical protein